MLHLSSTCHTHHLPLLRAHQHVCTAVRTRTHRRTRLNTHLRLHAQAEDVPPQTVPQTAAQTQADTPYSDAGTDAWDKAASSEGMTREEFKYTLNQMYLPKRQYAPQVQLDHAARRRYREVGEIAEAAQRQGISRAQVDEGIAKMASLLPEMYPNLEKMKASCWVDVIKDVNKVAMVIIILKSYYPKANLSKIIMRSPKILLQSAQQVQDDAVEIQTLVAGRLPDIEAVIEVCPELMKPAQMQLSISNMQRWFNKDVEGAFELLQKNPNLLNDIEEATLEADPTYDWEST